MITRTGTADSSMLAKLQDRDLQIEVRLYEPRNDTRTFVAITRRRSSLNKGMKKGDFVVYNGPLDEMHKHLSEVFVFPDGLIDITPPDSD